MLAVTAATGRLGHALLRYLAELRPAGELLAVARRPAQLRLPGITTRQGDYHDRAQMAEALDGVDTAVIISAPIAPGRDRLPMHRNVIAAARDAGVRKLVYTSVIGVDAPQDTMFAPSQQLNLQTESALAGSGCEWTVARNGLYLELDLGHVRRAQADGIYRNNAGEGRCGYISIDELAFATARLATEDTANGRIFNLVGETLTQAELVALACDVFDLQVRYESQSAEENLARFLSDPRMAARGEAVLRMLTGCFQCIAKGYFDVRSDYASAAGRPAKPVREQMEEIRAALG